MKSFFQALMLLLFLLPATGWPAEQRRTSDSRHLNGRDYTRVTEWAAANGFEARWLRSEESLQMASSYAKVVLTADSREVRANGVQIWLGHPVARQGGSLFASLSDLRSTVRPLLAPPRNRSGQKVVSVCLDAGHGGRDPGNQSGNNPEKRFTLLLAKELRDQLSAAGFKPSLTRNSDRFIELAERSDFANRKKADLFLCLHFNSAVSSRASVRGAEVYCLAPAGASSTNSQEGNGGGDWCPGNRNNDQNLFLGYQVQKALVRSAGVEDRGVRRARFAVLREAAMPAVLIEAGFMSHPAEGRKIFSEEYRRQLARAITEGVLAYKHEVER